jgi:hypothetical protein
MATMKKTAPRKRDRSLSPDYVTVEYHPANHHSPYPVRAGVRKPHPAEVEAEHKPETVSKKER